MSDRKPHLPPLIEWIVVAVILGVFLSILLPVVRDMSGPRGDPIPKQLPDEAKRFHHPAGFSIVAPPHWSAQFLGGILMAPLSPGKDARRSKALIVVQQIGQDRPPELDSMRKTRFLEHEAYEEMKIVHTYTIDDGAWSQYQLFFHHGKNWYLVSYGIATEQTTLPPMIRRYLNTLHLDESRSAPKSPSPQP